MALKTVQTTLATIQHRRGAEEKFDPDQMTAGEWAVSTDSKKVWMCFQPGLVRRMATYGAFEEDMLEVQKILATCQDIQTAVEAFEKLAEQHKNQAEAYSKESQSWAVGGTGTRAGEDTNNSKYWSQQSASSASSAAAYANTATSKANAASASEVNSASSATSAATSAETATQKANAAEASETSASASATSAATSAGTAAEKAGEASASASDAAISATSADTYAKKSQSYAVGGTGTRPGEDIDNSKYYYEQSKNISQGLSGTLIPMGTVPFSNLPALSTTESGWMYNISDRFTTTSDFMEGAGNIIPAGANVYKTAEGKWDILAGTPVTTVNGQTGNVVLEKDDIGLGNVPNVTTNDQTPTFIQATTRENIASGSKLSVIFGKIMKWYSDLKAVAFSGSYNDLSDKPNAMKNPAALTFTGAVTSSYDGSAAKSVAIPSVTNNDLATVPGTAWDAVRGAQIRKDLNPLIKGYRISNVSTKEQLYNFIYNIFYNTTAQVVSFELYNVLTSGDLGLPADFNGAYFVGTLQRSNIRVTGDLINCWSGDYRLKIVLVMTVPNEIVLNFWQSIPYGTTTNLQSQIDKINSDLVASGLLSERIDSSSINNSFTFSDLIAKKTVNFFTNWTDNTNFPHMYGSGIVLPCADSRHRLIIYITTGFGPYFGYYNTDSSEVEWKKIMLADS